MVWIDNTVLVDLLKYRFAFQTNKLNFIHRTIAHSFHYNPPGVQNIHMRSTHKSRRHSKNKTWLPTVMLSLVTDLETAKKKKITQKSNETAAFSSLVLLCVVYAVRRVVYFLFFLFY